MLTRRDGSDLRRRGENAHPAEPITRRCETTATQLLPWSLPVATVLTFSAPALVTQRTFQTDWTIHLWYLWEQSVALSHNHAPSLFVHADLVGLFWPHFAFYGGTMYALGGLLAIGLGHRPVIAFGLLHVLGFSMAYFGTTWVARQFGLRGWKAQLPGFVLLTSAYTLTLPYGRGAFGEFMATSSIPLLIASALSLLRHDRWRSAVAAVFVFAAVLYSGSHNITLLWGSIFLVALIAVAVAALPNQGLEVSPRRVWRVVGLAALAVGVNLWFLLPDLVYGQRTRIVGAIEPATSSPWFGQPGTLFNPLRVAPQPSAVASPPGIYVQLPIFVMAWVAVALVLGWPTLRREVARLVVALSALFLLLVALVVLHFPWEVVPSFLKVIQFPMRLIPYALLCLVGLMMVALRELPRQPRAVRRRLEVTLAVVLYFGALLAVWQVWHQPSVQSSRALALRAPSQVAPSVYDVELFRDATAPIVPVGKGRTVMFDPRALHDDRFNAMINLPPGPAPIATNVAAGPYLVDVAGGAHPVGRTRDGWMVIARNDGGRGPVHLRLAPASNAATVLGRIGSLVSLVGLLGLAVALAVGRRRQA